MSTYVKNWSIVNKYLTVHYIIEDESKMFRKQYHILNLEKFVGVEVFDLRSHIEGKEPSRLLRIDFGGEENSYTLKFIDEYQRTEFVNMVRRELADATMPASCCHD